MYTKSDDDDWRFCEILFFCFDIIIDYIISFDFQDKFYVTWELKSSSSHKVLSNLCILLQRDPGSLAQGFVDLDLWSSPGWWAATVATYCPSRMVEHPKSKSTKPCARPPGSRCTCTSKCGTFTYIHECDIHHKHTIFMQERTFRSKITRIHICLLVGCCRNHTKATLCGVPSVTMFCFLSC